MLQDTLVEIAPYITLLSIFGSIASFVGLYLTYKVYSGVSLLTQQYGLKKFVPERIETLRAYHRIIAETFNENNDSARQLAIDTFSKSKVTIEDLSVRCKKANPENYQSYILRLEKSFIESFDKSNQSRSKSDMRNTNGTLDSLIDAYDYFYQNETWSVNL